MFDVTVREGILLYLVPVHELPHRIVPAVLIEAAKYIFFKLTSQRSQEIYEDLKYLECKVKDESNK